MIDENDDPRWPDVKKAVDALLSGKPGKPMPYYKGTWRFYVKRG